MNSAYEWISIPLPCPSCGQSGQYRLRTVEVAEEVPCQYCSKPIPLAPHAEHIKEQVAGFKEIKGPSAL